MRQTKVAERWKVITPEQLKLGWMELRGVTPVHHNWIVLGQTDEGNYIVKVPELMRERTA